MIPRPQQQQHPDGIQAFIDIVEFAGLVQGQLGIPGLQGAPFFRDEMVGLQGVNPLLVDVGFQCYGPAEVVVPDVLAAASRRTDQQFAQGDGTAVRQ